MGRREEDREPLRDNGRELDRLIKGGYNIKVYLV